MKENNFEQLKKEYMSTPIPKELDFVVQKALKGSKGKMNRKKHITTRIAASAAAIVVMTTIGVNTSPVFAKTLSEVPVVSGIVKVLTFTNYTVDEKQYDAKITVPKIEGLKNKQLENTLNEKYIEQNKKLYDQFVSDMEKLKENGGGHLGIDSGYVVKTDNDTILSMGSYVVNTVGSSSTVFQYQTIDKKDEIVITLPSLFKDESYVDIISKNIKEQMVEQYNADNDKFYWVEGVDQKVSTILFEEIGKEQSFYISEEGKLIISFDKYEVAPGYMGVVEFVIPSEIIQEILTSNKYIK